MKKHHTPNIAIFFRQFSTLLSAGIPIIQCCDLLEKSQENSTLRLLIIAIKRDILSGKNLYHCLRQHPAQFDDFTCHLIQVGEHTGQLDRMLSTIATYHEKNMALKAQLKQALFYPFILLSMSFLITICMLIFIIPHFADLFHNTALTLPLSTRIIFGLSSTLNRHLWLLLISIPLIASLIYRYRLPLKPLLYTYLPLHRLPVFKSLLQKITLARFARHLAITLTAGIPITQAIKLASPLSTAQIRSKITAGQPLHHALSSLSYYPPLMIHMIKIGEESGTLETMLDKVADLYESDIQQLTHRMNQLLEPLIMLILGALIGGLVISLYLPIFALGSAL